MSRFPTADPCGGWADHAGASGLAVGSRNLALAAGLCRTFPHQVSIQCAKLVENLFRIGDGVARLRGMSNLRLRFDGGKAPERRKFLESGPQPPIDPRADVFRPYRKTSLTYATRVEVPFSVDTPEGRMEGKAGDYLAVGAAGEMYPIDAAVFAATYERAD